MKSKFDTETHIDKEHESIRLKFQLRIGSASWKIRRGVGRMEMDVLCASESV